MKTRERPEQKQAEKKNRKYDRKRRFPFAKNRSFATVFPKDVVAEEGFEPSTFGL